MTVGATSPLFTLAAMLLLTNSLASAQYSQRGRVVLWNAEPLPGVAEVEMFCRDGQSYKLAITNADGYFTPGIGLMANASEQDSKDRPKYSTNCQMRAILPGYVSSATSTRSRLIVLWPAEKTKGDAISATTALAPEGARTAFTAGMDSVETAAWEDAKTSFQEAVKIDDRYAEAWYQLGKVYRKLGNPEDARAAFLKAVETDPRYVYPYEGLYQLAFERDDMEDLLDKTETLLRLNPYEFPGAYYYNAVANLQLKHYAAGEKRIRNAIRYDPNYQQPLEFFVLGFLLANQGKTAEALIYFDLFLTLQPEGNAAEEARASMEKLQERRRLRRPKSNSPAAGAESDEVNPQ